MKGPHRRRYLRNSPSAPTPVIVSCGGGLIEIPEALALLKSQTHVIWLKMDEAGLVRFLEELDNDNVEKVML